MVIDAFTDIPDIIGIGTAVQIYHALVLDTQFSSFGDRGHNDRRAHIHLNNRIQKLGVRKTYITIFLTDGGDVFRAALSGEPRQGIARRHRIEALI